MSEREEFAEMLEASYHNASLLQVDMPLFDKAREKAITELDESTVESIIDGEWDGWEYWASYVFFERLSYEVQTKFGEGYSVISHGRGGATVIIDVLEDYYPGGFETAPYDLPDNISKVIEVQCFLNELVEKGVNGGYDYFITGELERAVEEEVEIMLAG